MKYFILLALPALITSCDSSNTNSLSGQYITKTCELAPESFGPHQSKYGKSIYEFASDNTIQIYAQFYTGAACTEETDLVHFEANGGQVVFTDLGETDLQEGVKGNKIGILLPTQSSPIDVQAFYVMINNELCFSNSIQFSTYGFSIHPSATDAIDFENCLLQHQP
jgi:hypothetical protein